MAVIVSFNGGQKTQRTIKALLGQVGHIHIVDNASARESACILEQWDRQSNISVTWLPVNKGIGCALNEGVRIARERGYRWLLTMDQDSIADCKMVQAYKNILDRNPSMVCVSPQYLANRSSAAEDVRPVAYAITSGNLVRMDVFENIGPYDEELFIDGIDFDFSLRIRKAGFSIYSIHAARMEHELGDRVCRIPVVGSVHTFHSPIRRYYIYRNFFYLFKKHARAFPGFFIKLGVVHVAYVLTILLLGEQRLNSIRYILYGIRDSFRGIKGPYRRG